jgi:hypothetical protein
VLRRGSAAFKDVPASAAPAYAVPPETPQPPAGAQEGARQVEQAYQDGGALAASQELDRQAQALGDDQAAIDSLITASQPTIDRISQDLAQRIEDGTDDTDEQPVTGDTIAALSGVADHAGAAGAQAIARSLAAALPDKEGLNQLDDAFDHLADRGEGTRLTLALVNELDAAGKTETAGELVTEAFDGINELRDDYKDARSDREEADQELATQLTDLEGALTDEQRAAYIEEYHQVHAEVYQREAEAALALSGAVGPNVDALNQVVQAHGDRADDVVDLMKDLAGSPQPAAAVEWAAKAFQDGSPTAEIFGDFQEEVERDVVQAGLPGTLLQYQAEADGDAGPALDRFQGLFNQFKSAYRLFTGRDQFQQAIQRGQEFIDAFRAQQAGDPTRLRALLSSEQNVRSLTPFTAGFAAAGVVFGIANAANAEDAEALVQGIGTAGRGGLELLAGGIGSLNSSGRLAALVGQEGAESAVRAARFATNRLIPGLAVGLNALTTVQSFRDALDDPSAENIVKLVGSATSLVGSVISLFPPAAPIGKAIELIGVGISLVGSWVFGDDTDARRDHEQEAILKEVLADEPYFQSHPDQLDEVSEQISRSDTDLGQLSEDAGLTQSQLFELVGSVDGRENDALEEVAEVATAVGLSGQQLVDALQGLDEEWGGVEDAWLSNLQLFEHAESLPEDSAERLEYLKVIAGQLGIEGPASLD